MTIPTKKLKNGFEMPVYGFGTWQMGGRNERDPENDDAADIAGIRAAIERGVTAIDTAEIYADGYSETLLGRAIEGYDRSKLFLSSKASRDHMRYDDILAACEASLARVGTEYFDLYLLHRHVPEVPLQETVRALEKLVADGLVKNIGVCNFAVESLKEAQGCTSLPIVYNQVHYNLETRECERAGLLKYCQENDVLLAAWRPFEKGALLADVPQVLQDLCAKYGKTPAQVAINWLVSQENVVTLSKTRHPAHLEENLGALGWNMDAQDIERLRSDYPGQRAVSPTVPLR